MVTSRFLEDLGATQMAGTKSSSSLTKGRSLGFFMGRRLVQVACFVLVANAATYQNLGRSVKTSTPPLSSTADLDVEIVEVCTVANCPLREANGVYAASKAVARDRAYSDINPVTQLFVKQHFNLLRIPAVRGGDNQSVVWSLYSSAANPIDARLATVRNNPNNFPLYASTEDGAWTPQLRVQSDHMRRAIHALSSSPSVGASASAGLGNMPMSVHCERSTHVETLSKSETAAPLLLLLHNPTSPTSFFSGECQELLRPHLGKQQREFAVVSGFDYYNHRGPLALLVEVCSRSLGQVVEQCMAAAHVPSIECDDLVLKYHFGVGIAHNRLNHVREATAHFTRVVAEFAVSSPQFTEQQASSFFQ